MRNGFLELLDAIADCKWNNAEILTLAIAIREGKTIISGKITDGEDLHTVVYENKLVKDVMDGFNSYANWPEKQENDYSLRSKGELLRHLK